MHLDALAKADPSWFRHATSMNMLCYLTDRSARELSVEERMTVFAKGMSRLMHSHTMYANNISEDQTKACHYAVGVQIGLLKLDSIYEPAEQFVMENKAFVNGGLTARQILLSTYREHPGMWPATTWHWAFKRLTTGQPPGLGF